MPLGISESEIVKELVLVESLAETQRPPLNAAAIAALIAAARAKLEGPAVPVPPGP